MYSLRESLFALSISVASLAAGVLGLVFFVPWLQTNPVETWRPEAQLTLKIGAGLGMVVIAAFAVLIVWLVVVGVADEKRHSRERKAANHRFANESTADRVIVARYNLAGERDTDLDVAIARQLWLVPTEDITAFNSYRVATQPFAALINHAPLYDKDEGQSFEAATKRPSIVFEHDRLWATSTGFDSRDEQNGRLKAIRDAFRPLIASGTVIAHIDIDTWEPKVPTDAKFRTHWKWTPPADPSAA